MDIRAWELVLMLPRFQRSYPAPHFAPLSWFHLEEVVISDKGKTYPRISGTSVQATDQKTASLKRSCTFNVAPKERSRWWKVPCTASQNIARWNIERGNSQTPKSIKEVLGLLEILRVLEQKWEPRGCGLDTRRPYHTMDLISKKDKTWRASLQWRLKKRESQYPSLNVRTCMYPILGSRYWTNDRRYLPLQVKNLTQVKMIIADWILKVEFMNCCQETYLLWL